VYKAFPGGGNVHIVQCL